MNSVQDSVREYYGKILKSSADLKTNVCAISSCSKKNTSSAVQEAINLCHPDLIAKNYGCGIPIPEALLGQTILDLGCGVGLDVFTVSKLVGQNGFVYGIDMTEEQLNTARHYISYHMEKFNYSKRNVDFRNGRIENLKDTEIKNESIDIIISNCVVNLSPDKTAVFKEAYRVLKIGGELYFSDIYVDRDLPEEMKDDPVVWGECISGALTWTSLMTLAKDIGFLTPRIVSTESIKIKESTNLKEDLKKFKIASVTCRLFKPPPKIFSTGYAKYLGTIRGHENFLLFDKLNKFMIDDAIAVDSELLTILYTSRFKNHFEILVDENAVTKLDDNIIDPFQN